MSNFRLQLLCGILKFMEILLEKLIKCCLLRSKTRKKKQKTLILRKKMAAQLRLHLLKQSSFNKQDQIGNIWTHISTNTSNMRLKRMMVSPFVIHEPFFTHSYSIIKCENHLSESGLCHKKLVLISTVKTSQHNKE